MCFICKEDIQKLIWGSISDTCTLLLQRIHIYVLSEEIMRTFSRFVFATSIADSQIGGHKETKKKKKVEAQYH